MKELVGRQVILYLSDDREFPGEVEFHDSQMTILKTARGSLIVYREKISAVEIISEEYEKQYSENSSGIDVNHYGSIIPEDMLMGTSEKSYPTDFSVSMSAMSETNVLNKIQKKGS